MVFHQIHSAIRIKCMTNRTTIKTRTTLTLRRLRCSSKSVQATSQAFVLLYYISIDLPLLDWKTSRGQNGWSSSYPKNPVASKTVTKMSAELNCSKNILTIKIKIRS